MPEKPFYITTPLYYANDELHIGHAFSTLAADTASRYHRLMGQEVFFLTGSDEHGQKVEQAAKAAGLTPIEHTNELVKKFKALWSLLDITNDDFIRTTEPRHIEAVEYCLNKLWKQGDIYEADYSGWYCTPCERFWTEKELADKLCPDCHRAVNEISEKNYFFKMSSYQQKLIDYINEHPNFICPENRKNEVLGFLKKPLGDLCISRPKSRLKWGIELPFNKDYVTYVWFDALTNYISAIGYPNDIERFNKLWPASCHIIGKDILTTHAVYWCTMLLALGLPLPECIFAHGWWVTGEGKMSKSVGNVINPKALVEKYGLDPFRFYLFREMIFGLDASYTPENFINRYNADLANDYGNLCQRTLPMLIKNRGGIFHKTNNASLPQTAEIASLAEQVKKEYVEAMNNFLFHDALKAVWGLIGRLNKYVDETAPWALAKAQKTDVLDEVFYTVGEGIRFATTLIMPFMPHIAPKFLEQIGCGKLNINIKNLQWGQLPDGTQCSEPKPLFPRLETERIQNLKNGAKAQKTKSNKAEKPQTKAETAESNGLISFDDFLKTELCIARVLEAEKVENADKLLKLSVDIESETRTVVAGIALHYKPEELVGKQIVMVKNLKPAKIRGIMSYGMILAAGTEEGTLALVSPDKPAKIGVRVK